MEEKAWVGSLVEFMLQHQRETTRLGVSGVRNKSQSSKSGVFLYFLRMRMQVSKLKPAARFCDSPEDGMEEDVSPPITPVM